MLVLLTRVLLWASVGLLIWYILARVIPKKYLTWFGGVILLLLLLAAFVEPDDGTVSVIWRILSFPLTPLGAAIVLLGSAVSEGVKKTKGNPVAIALAILLISSIPLSAQWLVSDAERSVRTAYQERAELCGDVCPVGIPGQGNLGEAAAIVVLGDSQDISKAITVADRPDDVSVNSTLTPRLLYAANLYQRARSQGASPVVVVTAGADPAGEQERNVIRGILSRNGVSEGDIQVQTTGLDVRSTSLNVEKFLQDRQVIAPRSTRRSEGISNDPRIVLVAPAIIMSRAALTFERRDLQVIAKPTDFYTSPVTDEGSLLRRLPEILPSVDALQLTTRYWNELLTSLYYFLRGWLPNFNFGWNSSIEI